MRRNRNEYLSKYMTRRYHIRRAKAIKQLGSVCVQCNEADTTLLEFDHIDPSTKLFVIGRRLSAISEKRLQVELNKCQLLCKSCHFEKSKIDFSNYIKGR